MLGAIIGDVVGSRFEFNNYRKKDFKIFSRKCFFTDDTVMTCAVADALINNKDIIENLKYFGRRFPGRGYGGSFYIWLCSDSLKPYNSFGNGAAMRVSSVGWLAKTELDVKKLSKKVTEITHNHEEGLKGAEATAMCIYLALNGYSKTKIRERMLMYYPEIANFDYKKLVRTYKFNETCQDTVPQAIYCFLISKNFIDCLRTSVSIGGDTDTLCAISCAIAEAYYGIPFFLIKKVKKYFNNFDKEILLKPLYKIYDLKNIDK